MADQITNGKITGTFLGTEDHGILTFYLYIESDCGSVGFGGYALDAYNAQTKLRIACAEGLQAIAAILRCVGVESWENLPGKYVRCVGNGTYAPILRIGHIIEDKWVDLAEQFREKTKAAPTEHSLADRDDLADPSHPFTEE